MVAIRCLNVQDGLHGLPLHLHDRRHYAHLCNVEKLIIRPGRRRHKIQLEIYIYLFLND